MTWRTPALGRGAPTAPHPACLSARELAIIQAEINACDAGLYAVQIGGIAQNYRMDGHAETCVGASQ